MEAEKTPFELAAEKLAKANELQARLKRIKELREQSAGSTGVVITVPGVSSSYAPSMTFGEKGHQIIPSQYATLYDFVAGQTDDYAKLAAIYVAEVIRQLDKDKAETEAELVALLA